MQRLNTDQLLEIKKHKWKCLWLPAVFIIASLALRELYGPGAFDLLSLVGVLIYLVIQVKYRVANNLNDIDEGDIVSPINGKIISCEKSLDKQIIVIRKGFFSPADICYPIADLLPNEASNLSTDYQIKGKVIIIKNTHTKSGDVYGMAPHSATVTLSIPLNYQCQIKAKQSVISAQTILAKIEKDKQND